MCINLYQHIDRVSAKLIQNDDDDSLVMTLNCWWAGAVAYGQYKCFLSSMCFSEKNKCRIKVTQQ